MDEEAGETGTVEDLPVGDLNWDKDTPVDKRLAPLEMAKLWKGIFFCESGESESEEGQESRAVADRVERTKQVSGCRTNRSCSKLSRLISLV